MELYQGEFLRGFYLRESREALRVYTSPSGALFDVAFTLDGKHIITSKVIYTRAGVSWDVST